MLMYSVSVYMGRAMKVVPTYYLFLSNRCVLTELLLIVAYSVLCQSFHSQGKNVHYVGVKTITCQLQVASTEKLRPGNRIKLVTS